MATRKKVSPFSDETYNVLKFIALIFLPALGTLYFALAGLWDLPKPTEVIGTITAVDVFLGVILGISTNTYQKQRRIGADGTLVVNNSDPNKDNYRFEVHTPLSKLEKKDTITLKVRSES